MIFNLTVFQSWFKWISTHLFLSLYDGVHMLCFEANTFSKALFFLLTSYQLSLFADWSTLPCHTQDQTISASLQRSKLYTQKAYGFSVPELTPADTFRLGPSDGATTVSCFDLCHSGDAMFVKVINKICAGTVLNNKSQISR